MKFSAEMLHCASLPGINQIYNLFIRFSMSELGKSA